MNDVFLLLGANLGDPADQLSKAIAELQEHVGTVMETSSLYESEAWGLTAQPSFLNQVVLLSTTLPALAVLDRIQTIENKLGRERTVKWGARIIDIDMLYFNNEQITHERLSVPHPYIAERKFTLMPLVEIAPQFVHPVLKLNNAALLANCNDPLNVIKHPVN